MRRLLLPVTRFLRGWGKIALKVLTIAVAGAAVLGAAPVIAQNKSALLDMEKLRQELAGDKKLMVAAYLPLTDAEAKAFWPIYESYQKEIARLDEHVGNIIVAYADAYKKGAVSNDNAKAMLDGYLALEAAELKIKRAYALKLQRVLPAVKAARYMQIEHKLRAIIRYELAANIPLVP